MPEEQTASWLGILDLYGVLPEGWTLIGGQLVHLHCAERGRFPERPTNDADTVIDVRADPTMLHTFTQALHHQRVVGVLPGPGPARLRARSSAPGGGGADRAAGVVTGPPGRRRQRVQDLALARLVGPGVRAGELLRDLLARGHRQLLTHTPRVATIRTSPREARAAPSGRFR